MSPAADSDDPRPLIVHVLYRLQVGGLENGVVNLINQMPHDRYRHAIVCMSEATEFRNRIQRPDVDIHEMHKNAGQDLGNLRSLYRLFRRIRPAIVHTRNIGCLEAQIPAWLAGVPCRVHGEHGWDVSDPDGSNRKYRWLRRLHAPLVHRFIALSRELQAYLLERAGIAANKVVRIYNGVDDSRFRDGDGSALPAGFADDRSIVFGTVGRMHGVKDQTNLCEAFIHLCESMPGQRSYLRLVMIGDGPLRETCLARLAEAGLAEQAWLPGSRDDIPEIMQSLDVFVLPSQAEGISNTILEAMASSLPVVATDVGGNAELVVDNETGALVRARDPVALAQCMGRYAEDTALRTRQGRAARQRILDEFSMQKMVSAYQNVYEQLLEQRGLAR